MVPAGQKDLKGRKSVKTAVLVPCYNEEAAIATVVKDFRAALPGATIYVYDNNSKDQTSARAAEADAAGGGGEGGGRGGGGWGGCPRRAGRGGGFFFWGGRGRPPLCRGR